MTVYQNDSTAGRITEVYLRVKREYEELSGNLERLRAGLSRGLPITGAHLELLHKQEAVMTAYTRILQARLCLLAGDLAELGWSPPVTPGDMPDAL